MEIEFDPDKEATNLAKHKISLRRATEFECRTVERIVRHDEVRLLSLGILDGRIYSLTFTFRRNAVRAISLRRAHLKELLNALKKASGV
jgi:uncharacterized DUF497 family protein